MMEARFDPVASTFYSVSSPDLMFAIRVWFTWSLGGLFLKGCLLAEVVVLPSLPIFGRMRTLEQVKYIHELIVIKSEFLPSKEF